MIFYFSGTGNTQWAAERLARETGERLLFIPDELKGPCRYELGEGERIGFCFPVHGWQPPHIVRAFVRKLSVKRYESGGPYVYVVCTCGDSIGRTIEMLQGELDAVGLRIDSAFSLVMPESYVCLPFMYTDKPEREKQKIAQADEELGQYLQWIVERRTHEVHTKRGLTPWLFSHVIGAYFNRNMITDRKFMVDEDRCVHCGKCAKVCPTGDLQFSNTLPHWRGDDSCTCCLACYHHCPQHAIHYGRITRSRGQYYFGHDSK